MLILSGIKKIERILLRSTRKCLLFLSSASSSRLCADHWKTQCLHNADAHLSGIKFSGIKISLSANQYWHKFQCTTKIAKLWSIIWEFEVQQSLPIFNASTRIGFCIRLNFGDQIISKMYWNLIINRISQYSVNLSVVG